MNDLKNKKIEIVFDNKSNKFVAWLVEGKSLKVFLFTIEINELKKWIKIHKKEGKIDVYSK